MLVLLISCPCALVISTPVTIAAALASAAREGVLIKGGAHLETAGRVRAVAVDKVGVLTCGEPEVERLIAVSGRSPAEILPKLAALESWSEHPLARAVTRFAEASGGVPAAAADFTALPGLGVEAAVDGAAFWMGGNRMLEEKGADSPAVRGWRAGLEDAERTVLYFGSQAEVWAILVLADRVRREAPSTLAAARAAGVAKLILLTGDNAVPASAAGRALGFDEVRAELMPEEKAAEVSRLRQAHQVVALAGDGINDIEGMRAASLGIAVGPRATDLAIETADVVLSGLGDLPFLLRHARRALGVIGQNIAIALAAKAAFAVLAGLGMATLWMAVLADTGATLLVTFNGLRLLRTGRP
jgi:Cd2+/Zn2+-exporting ATPase